MQIALTSAHQSSLREHLAHSISNECKRTYTRPVLSARVDKLRCLGHERQPKTKPLESSLDAQLSAEAKPAFLCVARAKIRHARRQTPPVRAICMQKGLPGPNNPSARARG